MYNFHACTRTIDNAVLFSADALFLMDKLERMYMHVYIRLVQVLLQYIVPQILVRWLTRSCTMYLCFMNYDEFQYVLVHCFVDEKQYQIFHCWLF